MKYFYLKCDMSETDGYYMVEGVELAAHNLNLAEAQLVSKALDTSLSVDELSRHIEYELNENT